jgi:hypothetical protein
MISTPIQEFKSVPYRAVLPQDRYSAPLIWTSPYLTTEYPKEGRPVGSDRLICKTVNGFLQIRFRDKAIFSDETIGIKAGLFGEYAGISGVIASTFIDFSDTATLAFLQSNGAVGFNQWTSFSNLAQNIYIKAAIYRVGEGAGPTQIDAVFSGSLLGSL